MKPILKSIAIGMTVVVVVFSQSYGESNGVRFDKNGLSVHAKGMALEDLFERLAEATGIQFIIDNDLAKTAAFHDFEGLPLLVGIKKILSPLNHAMIEDDSGRVSKVFIFGEGKDTMTLGERGRPEKPRGRRTDRYSAKRASAVQESDETDLPDVESLTEDEEFDSADDEEIPEDAISLTDEFHDSQTERAYGVSGRKAEDTEGPPIGQIQELEGPPESQQQEYGGPPDSGEISSDGPPTMTGPDNPPPMSSESGQMEGPPEE
jgi:hypothetical protein